MFRYAPLLQTIVHKILGICIYLNIEASDKELKNVVNVKLVIIRSLHPRNIRINIFPVIVMKGVSNNELFLERISSKISIGSYILYVHNISKKRKQLKKSQVAQNLRQIKDRGPNSVHILNIREEINFTIYKQIFRETGRSTRSFCQLLMLSCLCTLKLMMPGRILVYEKINCSLILKLSL